MSDEELSGPSGPPVGVLDRGLFLLHLFTLDRNRLYLRELSDLSGLDKATTLRALKSLVKWGFLERHGDGSYSPGPANLRLAAIFRATSNLMVRIDRPLTAISERVGKSASFFTRSDGSRVCLGRSRKNIYHTDYVELGTSVPLDHGGSAARMILAHTGDESPQSAAVRDQGFAISKGERLRHFISISFPVLDVDESFLGALTLAGLSVEVSEEDLRRDAVVVREELIRHGFLTSDP